MVSVNLPWELVEEILCRVPPQSLTRFRTVCKQWNFLFDDKRFVNNHLVRSQPQFIFQNNSKIYSVTINFNGPQIEVHELTLTCPGLECEMPIWPYDMVYCDGLMFCTSWQFKGVVVWNPCLRQTRWFASKHHYPTKYDVGYDNKKRDSGYKMLNYNYESKPLLFAKTMIYEVGLDAKEVKDLGSHSTWSATQSNSVSVNGTLYWASVDVNNGFFIRSFNFSTERRTTFCRLPFNYDEDNILALAVFRKDRLSLFDLCNKTSKIKIWLTKNNIDNREDVVWIKLMKVSIPNFPKFSFFWYNRYDLTYFLDNNDAKRLVICCYDESDQQAYIYIVRGDMFKKIKIDYEVDRHICPDLYPHFRTYVPSLVRPSAVPKLIKA